jgi:hypothetical protein
MDRNHSDGEELASDGLHGWWPISFGYAFTTRTSQLINIDGVKGVYIINVNEWDT